MSAIEAGLKGTAELVVGEEHTAPSIGSGKIHVLGTPIMINLMESAALAAAEHLLPAGHQSLGTHLDVSHVASPPMMKIASKFCHHFPGVRNLSVKIMLIMFE